MGTPDAMTYQEAAEYIGTTVTALRSAVSRGDLSVYRPLRSKLKMLRREDVERYKRGERVKPTRQGEASTARAEESIQAPEALKSIWTDLDKAILAMVGGVLSQMVAYGTNAFTAFLHDYTEAKKNAAPSPLQRLTSELSARLEPIFARIDRNGGMVTSDDTQELQSLLQDMAQIPGQLTPADLALIQQVSSLLENYSKQNKMFAISSSLATREKVPA